MVLETSCGMRTFTKMMMLQCGQDYLVLETFVSVTWFVPVNPLQCGQDYLVLETSAFGSTGARS